MSLSETGAVEVSTIKSNKFREDTISSIASYRFISKGKFLFVVFQQYQLQGSCNIHRTHETETDALSMGDCPLPGITCCYCLMAMVSPTDARYLYDIRRLPLIAAGRVANQRVVRFPLSSMLLLCVLSTCEPCENSLSSARSCLILPIRGNMVHMSWWGR